MANMERDQRDNSFRKKGDDAPSFSSALLEHIYSSIDDHTHPADAKLANKMDIQKNTIPKPPPVRLSKNPNFVIKLDYVESDPQFFSSGSNSSSDSNSSLFSEHDSIPLPTKKTRSSCFLPPKPIRTGHNKKTAENDDDVIPSSTKSSSVYAHLKKMRQPISPGLKLTTFINSILNKHSKKSVTKPSDAKPTCSSATSFSRSVLTRPLTNASSIKPLVKLVPANIKTEAQPVQLKRDEMELLRLRHQLIRASAKPNLKMTTNIIAGRVSEDAASDCSEDLFELDHVKFSSNYRNGGELPVFNTTRIINS